MDILERYLQAIGRYLPLATRDDVVAELRANLLDQIDARAEDLHRPLTEAELADILRAHGRPEVVAVRYLPQRSLIGPALFPAYLLTLRKGLPLVALFYAIAAGAKLILSPIQGSVASAILQTLGQFIPTLFISCGIITLVFVIIESIQAKHGPSVLWKTWDPTKLPPLASDVHPKQRSLASRIVNLVIHCFWLVFVLLIASHPFLMIFPSAIYLNHPLAFGPVWHTFYLLVIALLSIQLVMCILALANGPQPWRTPLDLLTRALGVAAAAVFAMKSNYFIATSPATDLHKLAALNAAINRSSRIVLYIAILVLLVHLWKYVRPKFQSTSLAF